MKIERDQTRKEFREGDSGIGSPDPNDAATADSQGAGRNSFSVGHGSDRGKELPTRQLREGDSGIGHPDERLDEWSPLSESERESAESFFGDVEKTPISADLHERNKTTGFVPLILLLGAGTVAFLFLQLVEAYSTINSMSLWIQVMSMAVLAPFVILVAFYLVRVSYYLYQFSASPSVLSGSLDRFGRGKKLDALDSQARKQYWSKLDTYMDEFERGDDWKARLRHYGIDDESIGRLIAVKGRCQDPEAFMESKNRIMTFYHQFQAPLDQCARERIQSASKRAALMAALSPFKVLDVVILLKVTFGLLHDLMRIYNVRPSAIGTSVLFARALGTAYLGEVWGEAAENSLEGVRSKYLTEFASEGGGAEDTLTEGVTAAAGEVGAKNLSRVGQHFGIVAGESLTAWFFTKRLGKAAMTCLQPVPARVVKS